MNNMGGMMWGMGLVWLIIIVVLVLARSFHYGNQQPFDPIL